MSGSSDAAPGSPAASAQQGDAGTRAGPDRAEGTCLCGAIRYRIALPPLWVAHCHCSMCRRAQGAGFVTWAGTVAAAFEFTRGHESVRRYVSSAAATRSFCGRCGTPLCFESTHWPGEIHVTLGSLEAAVAKTLVPEAHSYWSSRVSWADWSGRNLRRIEPPDHGQGA